MNEKQKKEEDEEIWRQLFSLHGVYSELQLTDCRCLALHFIRISPVICLLA